MIQPSPAEQPMIARLAPLRCGRCAQIIGEVNMRLPSELALQCRRCTKDERGRQMVVYTMLKVVIIVSDTNTA